MVLLLWVSLLFWALDLLTMQSYGVYIMVLNWLWPEVSEGLWWNQTQSLLLISLIRVDAPVNLLLP